jgi:hypothetical protein
LMSWSLRLDNMTMILLILYKIWWPRSVLCSATIHFSDSVGLFGRKF